MESSGRTDLRRIRRLAPEELAGAALAEDPRHVPAVSMPDGYDRFDARFFGLSPREREVLALHREIVEIPSVSGDEAHLADFLETKLRRYKARPERVGNSLLALAGEADPGRAPRT